MEIEKELEKLKAEIGKAFEYADVKDTIWIKEDVSPSCTLLDWINNDISRFISKVKKQNKEETRVNEVEFQTKYGKVHFKVKEFPNIF